MMTYSHCVGTKDLFGTQLFSSANRSIRTRQSSNNRIFRVGSMNNGLCFKKEMSVPYSITGDGYIAFFEEGPIIISAVADNFAALKREFEKEVLDSWQYYAEEDDNKMTNGAIEVKNWLHDNIIKG